MNNIFDAPPEGALVTNHERPLSVEYKSGKIPHDFAKSITPEWIADKAAAAEIGFYYYNSEAKQNVPISDLTFIVLEVYSGASGWDNENKTAYWSNRVRDTRSEDLRIMGSGSKSPLAVGRWTAIKASLPDAVKYSKFVIAYCLQMDKVMEIKLSAAAERGLQKAVAAAEMSVGRSTDWHKVFTLALAQSDHFWGFHLKGYFRSDKEGNEHAGKTDLYLEPTFYAGVLSPVNQAELHEKCCRLQQQERDRHEEYRKRYAANDNEEKAEGRQQEEEQPQQVAVQAAQPQQGFPERAPDPADDDDDLPF